jgi:eukaryotic-like serine/threonine-protein kinase
MPMVPGSKLGPYEILSSLGVGGMGEVYRAHDPRLGRDVAIKVLPADRMADQSRRRRFVHEARAASALNHPSIVTIHEIASEDGIDFIVMEYVRGRTLAALIRRRGMPLPEALRVAIPIADALARAHAVGIVHRDPKPANVIVGPDGTVKVLDFGLAKLTGSDDGSDDHRTVTMEAEDRGPLSEQGRVAGTVGYMSPEQQAGKKVDARSDVFSFGAVLYEMITGQRAFPGGSSFDLPRRPSDVARGVPRDLEKLILRCLRMEPEQRFHMADVKLELEQIREELASPARLGDTAKAEKRRLGSALLLVLVAGASLGGWRLWRSREMAASPARVVPLTSSRGVELTPALSPDGEQVAFSWEGEAPAQGRASSGDIWLQLVGGSEARRLTDDPADEVFPSWSPDGRQIAFIRFEGSRGPLRPVDSAGLVHLVSPLGSSVRQLSDVRVAHSQLAWSVDGRWLAASRARRSDARTPGSGGIELVPVLGGASRAITTTTSGHFDAHPAFSPDGRSLAYASCVDTPTSPCHVYVVDLDAELRPRAPPRRVTHREAGTIAGLAWARDGRSIVFSGGLVMNRLELWRVGVEGDRSAERVEIAGWGAVFPATVASRDRLVFARGKWDVNIHRFERGSPPRAFLSSTFHNSSPSFSPDGQRIVFDSGRSADNPGGEDVLSEIWVAQADGSGAVQLTRGPGRWQASPRWSPDGRRVVFESRGEEGYSDIWTIDVAGGTPRRLTHGPLQEALASWSRDGRWVYYREDRIDGRDIWRVPDGGGTPERLTHKGGLVARESPDGKTLFYTRSDRTSPLLALRLDSRAERQVADCVISRSLADGPDGMYYLGCPPGAAEELPSPGLATVALQRLGHLAGLAMPELPLLRYDPATGRTHLLGVLETGQGWFNPMAVSPDGRTILFTRQADPEADLVLIENFR